MSDLRLGLMLGIGLLALSCAPERRGASDDGGGDGGSAEGEGEGSQPPSEGEGEGPAEGEGEGEGATEGEGEGVGPSEGEGEGEGPAEGEGEGEGEGGPPPREAFGELIDDEGDVGWQSALALDSRGRPHVAYPGTFGDVGYARRTEAGWWLEVIDMDDGRAVDIAMDSDDVPHVLVVERPRRTEMNSLLLASRRGGAWRVEQIFDDGDVIGTPSLVIDRGDVPHIAFTILGGSDDLRYATRPARVWFVESVDPTADAALSVSIAVDPDRQPHITYHHLADDELRHAVYAGGQWTPERVDSSDHRGMSSMLIDRRGIPHIAYTSQAGNDLNYAFKIARVWSTALVDGAGGLGNGLSIALDPDDVPHIAYYEASASDLRYAFYDRNRWASEPVVQPGLAGNAPSLAVDTEGNAHISHGDGTNPGNSNLMYHFLPAR